MDMQTGQEVDWSWLAVDLSQPKGKKKIIELSSNETTKQALNDMFDLLNK